MSKKKRTGAKKHHISPSHLVGSAAAAPLNTPAKQSQVATIDVNDTSFVGPEVRKVLLLAALFIGTEVVLWVVFTHTGLGDTVYRVVRP